MRLLNYLLEEWKFKDPSYAGRSISKSNTDSDKLVVWIYLTNPKSIGLVYTLPNGKTFLDGKQIGTFQTTDLTKATHRVILEHFKSVLGIDFDIRDYYEENIRGRIIKDEFYVYDYDTTYKMTKNVYQKNTGKIFEMFKKYLTQDWWLKA